MCTLTADSFSGDVFSNVIVNVSAGTIARVEAIADGGDLSAVQSQKTAMVGARRSLEAVTAEAVRANAGYRAVSAMPSLDGGHPVLEVVLVRGLEWKAVSEHLD